MQDKKIYFVAGARPQFIKLAPVLLAMKAYPNLTSELIHTGQHYDSNLSDDFFKELKIDQPIINLQCGSGSAYYQFSYIIEKLGAFLEINKPDMLVVVGDTNSTAAAAITARLMRIKLAHIEAGLREFDLSIPEEINKVITDRVADIYFCPSETAVRNLREEKITGKIVKSGDPGLDLLFNHPIDLFFEQKILDQYQLRSDRFYFATIHRQINTEKKENLEKILTALTALDHPLLISLHPRTRKAIADFNLTVFYENPNITFIEPISFWATQALIKHAKKVITDSGGIIKECYFHNTFVIIVDQQTEWVEVIQEGKGMIAGADILLIKEALKKSISSDYPNTSFGNGKSAFLIADTLSTNI